MSSVIGLRRQVRAHSVSRIQYDTHICVRLDDLSEP